MEAREWEPPKGSVVWLADRIPDARRVSLVLGFVSVALALSTWPFVRHLIRTANLEPLALEVLRSQPDPPAVSPGPLVRPAIFVLLDGVRAADLNFFEGPLVEVELPEPTLTKAYLHQVFTGVPPDGTGVRLNGFHGPARVDSLADRVRSHGGTVAFFSPGLDFFSDMYARPGDLVRLDHAALDAPLLSRISGPEPRFTVVHLVATDGAAHDRGVDSAEYRAALAESRSVVRTILERAHPTADIYVTADHGHRNNGGHGGPEPEVSRVALAIRGFAPRIDRPIRPTEIATWIAARLGVAPPQHSVEVAPTELMERSYPTLGADRRRTLETYREYDRAKLSRARLTPLVLTGLFGIMALGALKRGFAGLDRATWIAPLLAVMVAVLGHLALGRPFSYSAIDGVVTHGARLAGLGAMSALVAIAFAAWVSRAPRALAVRRAAAGVTYGAALACAIVLGFIGYRFGPWPLTTLERYLPLFALGCGGGMFAVAGGTLLSTLAFRRDHSPAEGFNRA